MFNSLSSDGKATDPSSTFATCAAVRIAGAASGPEIGIDGAGLIK